MIECGVEDNVVFAGRIPVEDIWRYYALSDVFVSASVAEAHSMSNLEAIAHGLPLLCHEDEALDGVLDNGYNGFAYNTREEFVDCACKLLNDEELRKSMGEASLKKAEDFSTEKIAMSAVRIYEDAISAWKSKTRNEKGQPQPLT